MPEGPTHPREVRERIAAGDLSAEEVVDAILTSTRLALDRPQRVVIAHFGSILPKIGLSEADLPASGLEQLAAEAARTGQEIEISERWRCPSAATLRPFLRRGVTIALSTDSHKRETIGRYDALPRGAARARSGLSTVGVLEGFLTCFVLAGSLPLLAGCYQFALAGLHRFRLNAERPARARAERRGGRPGVERGVRDRADDRHAALARLPARAAARLCRRRREHRRDARRRAREGGRVPGPRVPPAPGQGRRGQGAHAQPRAAHRSARRAGTRRCWSSTPT